MINWIVCALCDFLKIILLLICHLDDDGTDDDLIIMWNVHSGSQPLMCICKGNNESKDPSVLFQKILVLF